jgi:phosphonate transport system substrate-binding protein
VRILKILAAAAAFALPAQLVQAQKADEVNFGIISTESSANLKSIWEPFLATMSKQTGLKINGFYASDYTGVIEAMRFNKVQLAWFGNKSAMEAVDRAGGEVFAQSVDADGNPGYWSHLIVHKDTPIEKLEDVLKCDKTADFSIGDPQSTSGFLVPTTYIFAAKGVDPKTCFKTLRNASHEANAMAVANRQVTVATNNSENLRRLEKTAPEARKNLKIVWTSPLIPSDPLVWRKDLDPAVKSKLYTFIMTYGRNGTPEEIAAARKVLAALQWAPFKPSSDAQLYPIRQLELNKEIMKVKADGKLADADKTTKVADLQKELDRINQLAAKTPSM